MENYTKIFKNFFEKTSKSALETRFGRKKIVLNMIIINFRQNFNYHGGEGDALLQLFALLLGGPVGVGVMMFT